MALRSGYGSSGFTQSPLDQEISRRIMAQMRGQSPYSTSYDLMTRKLREQIANQQAETRRRIMEEYSNAPQGILDEQLRKLDDQAEVALANAMRDLTISRGTQEATYGQQALGAGMDWSRYLGGQQEQAETTAYNRSAAEAQAREEKRRYDSEAYRTWEKGMLANAPRGIAATPGYNASGLPLPTGGGGGGGYGTLVGERGTAGFGEGYKSGDIYARNVARGTTAKPGYASPYGKKTVKVSRSVFNSYMGVK